MKLLTLEITADTESHLEEILSELERGLSRGDTFREGWWAYLYSYHYLKIEDVPDKIMDQKE